MVGDVLPLPLQAHIPRVPQGVLNDRPDSTERERGEGEGKERGGEGEGRGRRGEGKERGGKERGRGGEEKRRGGKREGREGEGRGKRGEGRRGEGKERERDHLHLPTLCCVTKNTCSSASAYILTTSSVPEGLSRAL